MKLIARRLGALLTVPIILTLTVTLIAMSFGMTEKSFAQMTPQTLPQTSVATSLPPGLDVNDVSILIPVGAHGLHPKIALKTSGIIHQALFEQVLRFEFSQLPLEDLPYVDSRFITDFSRWYITSFRIEDCGEVLETTEKEMPDNSATSKLIRVFQLTKGAGCQARARFVAQPLNLFGITLPTAMHFLLNLDSSELEALARRAKEFQQLGIRLFGVSSIGTSLGLHPGLVAESQAAGKTDLADHLRTTIEMAVQKNSAAMSLPNALQLPQVESVTMTIQTEINHWKFTGGLVRNGKWVKSVTEFNSQFNSPKSFSDFGVEDLACDIHSKCLLTPDPKSMKLPLNPTGFTVSSIFQDDPAFSKEQVPGRRSPSTLELAEIIDTVPATHFFNTTCVSCHQSSNLRSNTDRVIKSAQPSGLTPFVAKAFTSPFTNNIINFGYFGANARVSTRTASETIEVANRVNKQLGWQNPAPLISDLDKFWTCLRTQSNSSQCHQSTNEGEVK